MQLVWPINDTSGVDGGASRLRVMATISPGNSSEKSLPLKDLVAKILLFGDRARNEFAVERESEHHQLLRIRNGNRDEARKAIHITVTYGPHKDGSSFSLNAALCDGYTTEDANISDYSR